MKNNRYEDERVRMQKLKIGSEALSLVMVLLMVSMLVKQFVLEAPFKEYMIEFIGFFGASVYIIIRNIFVGNTLFPNTKKKSLYIIPLVCGVTITIVSFVSNLESHLQSGNLAMTLIVLSVAFITSTIGSFVVIYLIYRSNEKRSKKLEEKFDN